MRNMVENWVLFSSSMYLFCRSNVCKFLLPGFLLIILFFLACYVSAIYSHFLTERVTILAENNAAFSDERDSVDIYVLFS